MEENGVDHDVTMERCNDLLVINCSSTGESKRDDRIFKHLTCMDSRERSFGQSDSPAALPITVRVSGSSPSSAVPVQLSQPQPLSAEEFHLVNPDGQPLYELQSLGGPSTQMMIVASHSENGQVLHVIPSAQPGMAQVIIPQGQLLDVTSTQDVSEEKCSDGNLRTVAVAAIGDSTSSYVLHPHASLSVSKRNTTRLVEDPFPIPVQPLPPNIPSWARRLRNCEKIGDSYRGYCVSETELESVLTLHKQQTQSVWGTRQSPSPAKPATRLMWKSQYVPYDGIPFVNAGSRAIVMECQYGPRRKGFQPKKAGEQESASGHLYKATCPARIYIKKVQKFPEYRVPTDPKIDKKIIRMEQEKAFNMLKKNLIDAGGVLRWYVQLPTQQAHQYHEMETSCLPSSPSHFPMPSPEEDEEVVRDENCTLPSRLHPQVADKIRELVSQGIEQVYAVRKQLRKYVERELFKPDEVPERHNLSFFPTVNDIKNHIHEVQKSLRSGEMVYNSESIPATLQWTTDSGNVLTETVTVTFASPPSDGSSPTESVITKAESNQSGESLLPETAQLLSSLSSFQPKIFAQLQGLQLQSTFTSTNGSTALIAVNNHSPPSPASLLDSIGSAITNQLSQEHSLQVSTGLTQHGTAGSAFGHPPGSEQSLVTMGQLVAVGGIDDPRSLEGGVHQILLGDVQTIPVRIMDSHPLSQKVSSRSIQQAATKKFYKLARDIKIMKKMCKILWEDLQEQKRLETDNMTSVKLPFFGRKERIFLPQIKNKKHFKLSFNTSKFRASKDHLPLRVIQITRKRPEWRTEEEVKFVQSCLQEIESYQSYSLRLQFLLAKVIRFEWFERGRVILKKGHCSISFYFIYFGSVALTDDEDGSSIFTALYPVVLQKGAKFGEDSLLKGTRRVATVVCMEDTKLFVVDKDDFFAHKLDEELQEELCCRYNFIKGVNFFAKWSKRSIVTITNSCKMEKFHYGQVITKDITNSDSIILISKGTCEILRLVDLTACLSYHKWVHQQLMYLSKISPCLTRKTGAVGRKRFEDFLRKSFPVQVLTNLKARDLKCNMSQGGQNVNRHPTAARAKRINQKLEKQQIGGRFSYDDCDNTKIGQREMSGLFHKTKTILTPYGEIPTDHALAVYMRVAEVHEEEIVGISQHFFPDHMQDRRSMVLVSKDAEVIWLRKDSFEKLVHLREVLELHKRYPSDDELCQKFLEENQWKIIKKDLASSILQRKCAPKITPVFEKPGEHVHNSWTVNQAGILDLSVLYHKPSQQHPHKFVPLYLEQRRQYPITPDTELRLIHSIISPQLSLKGLF